MKTTGPHHNRILFMKKLRLLPTAAFLGTCALVSAQEPARAPFSFAPVVERVTPSVVGVFTSKTIRPRLQNIPPEWRRFFGEGPGGKMPNQTMQGLGSGVIVSEDGYILTNNHVVDGADEIMVQLKDHKEYKAKKIGADSGTDVAVLKIDAKSLPAITFADSDKARVGDIVLAVGSPYGLAETVTMGIVSGLGRGGMHISDYENFIQTDASINPGNSGGALIDAEGRLLGINTAIFSQTGGNVGIGFAIPANLARASMQGLRDHGHVVRGFLGLRPQPLTHELAEAFKMKDSAGALVADVPPNTPAAKAGIKTGDVIVDINGKKIEDDRSLRLIVSGLAPGLKAKVKFYRNGEEKTVDVELGELPKTGAKADGGEEKQHVSNVLDGITVVDLDRQARETFNIPAEVEGVVITDVDAESAAHRAGLNAGDVIQEVNRKPVKNANEAIELGDKIGRGDRALLRVWSKGGSRYLALEPK